MGDAERTIDTMAVLERRIHTIVVLIVTVIAKVVSAEAAEESSGAAEHAFPVNLFCSVLFTACSTGTKFLQEAVLAPEVFRLGLLLLSVSHFLFAVN